MDKKSLRKSVSARIKAMTADEKKAESDKVAAKVLNLGLKGRKIFIYNALPDEVETKDLIAALAADNDIYLPVVDGEDMLLARYGEELSEGAYGIYEPDGKRYFAEEIAPDVCITPLRAFDAKLNRLGRGKGYYDRFFAAAECKKIAIAFDCQKADEIPTDAHDIKMDAVITASETYLK